MSQRVRVKESESRSQSQGVRVKESKSRSQRQGVSVKDSASRSQRQGFRVKESESRSQSQGVRVKESESQSQRVRFFIEIKQFFANVNIFKRTYVLGFLAGLSRPGKSRSRGPGPKEVQKSRDFF
jgi:hypothetical protein